MQQSETYLEKICRIGRDANPFFRMMGVNVVEIGEGTAILSMAIRPEMKNGVGWLQGGLFTALADEAMALALYSVTDSKKNIATIAEQTSFLRGAQEGTLVACGRVVRSGRRVAFLEGEVRLGSADGDILARTSASFLIVP